MAQMDSVSMKITMLAIQVLPHTTLHLEMVVGMSCSALQKQVILRICLAHTERQVQIRLSLHLKSRVILRLSSVLALELAEDSI